MSDESKNKEKTFEFPMMPIFGVDLGERLGSMDARLVRVEADIQKLDTRMDVFGAKIELAEARLGDKTDTVEVRLLEKIDAVEARLTEKIEAVEARLDNKIDAAEARLDNKIDAVKAELTEKIEAVDQRVDKCLVAINRLDERMIGQDARLNNLSSMMIGLWITVIGGFILQFFFK